MCIALYTQCFPSVCGQNFTGNSQATQAGFEPTTSCLLVQTFFPQTLGKHWVYSAIHTSVYKNRLEAVQRRAARFVCKDSRRKSSVSLMISKLQWKSLEERRAISRLSLLYTSVHHKTAIDTDHYQFKPQGIKLSLGNHHQSRSPAHPSTKKDCYKFSFLQELLLNGIYYQYV